MGFYDGIDNNPAATDRGSFVRAGHYLVRIDRIRSGTSQNHSCDYVAIDMTVLHDYDDGDTPMMVNPETERPKDWVPDQKGPHRVGEQISAQFLAKHKSAKGNYKAFIANAVGASDKEVDAGFCLKIEQDELLNGSVVELNNRMIEKKDGGPFTKVWAVRRVEEDELSRVLPEEVVNRYFPEGLVPTGPDSDN